MTKEQVITNGIHEILQLHEWRESGGSKIIDIGDEELEFRPAPSSSDHILQVFLNGKVYKVKITVGVEQCDSV